MVKNTAALDFHHAFYATTGLLIRIGIGVLITLGLFLLMATLVKQEAELNTSPPLTVLGSIVFEEPDENTIKRTQPKPKPEVEQPPKPQLPDSEPDENQNEFNDKFAINNTIDKVKLDTNLSFNSDSLTRPIVRVTPSYPPDAARNGIEGWVELQFDVDSSGQVTNILITDAQPKRIFDRAAKKALKRWKYKPSIKNGAAVDHTGLSVVLEFKLDNQASND